MQAARPAIRNLVCRNGARSYHGGDHLPKPTLNDLPSPQGAWQTLHDVRQRRYNTTLVAGIISLGIALGAMKAVGLLKIYKAPDTYE